MHSLVKDLEQTTIADRAPDTLRNENGAGDANATTNGEVAKKSTNKTKAASPGKEGKST